MTYATDKEIVSLQRELAAAQAENLVLRQALTQGIEELIRWDKGTFDTGYRPYTLLQNIVSDLKITL